MGGGRADNHRRLQRIRHDAQDAGRTSACASGSLRSYLLRGRKRRRIGIQRADDPFDPQWLALAQGLVPDPGGRSTATNAVARAVAVVCAVASLEASSSAATPADPDADRAHEPLAFQLVAAG
jgi:hypothetical protein